MAKAGIDSFVQRLSIATSCTQTNPTVYRPTTTYNVKDRKGLIIHDTRYTLKPGSDLTAGLNADAAYLTFGLTFFSSISAAIAILPGNIGFIEHNTLQRADFGTAASGYVIDKVVEHDYSRLPGGGLIVHPAAFGVFGFSGGAASVDLVCDLHYTMIDLSETDWQDIWELLVATQSL